MSFERKTALVTGLLFIATFVTSIAAAVLYKPIVDSAGFAADTASNGAAYAGAVLELLLIAANIGTAVVLFPVLRRRHEAAALGYVTARVMECVFIAIGIVSVLALTSLRQSGSAALAGAGAVLVAIHDWTFVLGPGFVVGIGNGMLLGYMMYRSGLVPRGLAMFGLVGGPLICISGAAVICGVIDKGSAAQAIATVPEIIWEAGLGLYLAFKGFKSPTADAQITRDSAGTSALRAAAAS